ncbi:universal stress protein [Pseudoclavibacter chungangensis]|uniref:Universal stress protein n=1 Tax=Pseudoclavibacter chungangensis TaxID=587635 RepID=A0A7J5BMA3_9MICO|nr:universal stress protein [Pseudoclavibacter chungangensis]KAB1652226.1 universal stress protein [Pseudoclavibacter chungangensis]NYJ67584.1 nucleotide-binding universal stress UspA family protein [Pseudoclavibacter chungangensis]
MPESAAGAATASGSGRPERIVVGYIADKRGHDAVALAAFLAEGTSTEIIITMVTPEPTAYGAYPRNPASDPIVLEQLEAWGEEARALVPAGIDVVVEQRFAESEAHGLMEAAEEHGANRIVIGAQASAILRRFTIGTVANTLLHASTVPVALAPAGFAEAGPVRRITCIYGTRPGAAELIGRSIERAIVRDVPVRLLSLVQVDRAAPSEVREVTQSVRDFAGERLATASKDLLASGRATIEVIEGESFEDAIEGIDWREGDLALIGSSRLANGPRIFVGNRALRILRRLPVPVVVIPRDIDPDTGVVRTLEA